MCRPDHRKSRDRVNQHLRADFVLNRVRQRHHGTGRDHNFIAPGAWRGEEGHSETLFQPESRIDLGADLTHDAGAFKSGHPPTGSDRRRRSERWRARDTVKIAWMDRRVR